MFLSAAWFITNVVDWLLALIFVQVKFLNVFFL